MKLKKPKFWDHKKPSLYSYILLPFTIILNLITKIKSKPKLSNSKIKTICIGNFYIGGTGKTSLAIKIKQILDKNNIKACFIKKFYSDQIDEQKLLIKNEKNIGITPESLKIPNGITKKEAEDFLNKLDLNQKFKVLSKLNHERISCGAFKTGNYIYAFGGDGEKSTYWKPQITESVERLDLNNNQGFEEVKI